MTRSQIFPTRLRPFALTATAVEYWTILPNKKLYLTYAWFNLEHSRSGSPGVHLGKSIMFLKLACTLLRSLIVSNDSQIKFINIFRLLKSKTCLLKWISPFHGKEMVILTCNKAQSATLSHSQKYSVASVSFICKFKNIFFKN